MRTVSVDADRLAGWLRGFEQRHGAVTLTTGADRVVVAADDGAVASILVPFPPLVGTGLGDLITHVTRRRTVGALLIRRGGVAVGVFEGRHLLVSKIETAYVQGRTKAGGWSQQRYARRRANQARKLTETAADLLAALVLPRVDGLESLATGGDRTSVDAVLADARLGPLRDIAPTRVYPVPDPRLAVLQQFPETFLAVEIELNDLA